MKNESAPTGKGMFWTGVVISGLVSLMLLMAATMELIRAGQVVEGFKKYNYPLESLPYIGAALLLSVILYAVPRTAVLGAILITGYLGGAVATHVQAQEGQFVMPVLFGVLTWLGLFLRDSRLRQLLPWSK